MENVGNPKGAPAHLDEFSMDEWWDVARKLLPGLDREEFERDWATFQRAKKFRQ